MKKDPCDDSVILRVVAAFAPSNSVFAWPGPVDVGGIHIDASGPRLLLNVGRDGRRHRYSVPLANDGVPKEIDATRHEFGIMKLGPGTWDIVPSIHVAGQFHAYVTLVGVPDPAPWEGA